MKNLVPSFPAPEPSRFQPSSSSSKDRIRMQLNLLPSKSSLICPTLLSLIHPPPSSFAVPVTSSKINEFSSTCHGLFGGQLHFPSLSSSSSSSSSSSQPPTDQKTSSTTTSISTTIFTNTAANVVKTNSIIPHKKDENDWTINASSSMEKVITAKQDNNQQGPWENSVATEWVVNNTGLGSASETLIGSTGKKSLSLKSALSSSSSSSSSSSTTSIATVHVKKNDKQGPGPGPGPSKKGSIGSIGNNSNQPSKLSREDFAGIHGFCRNAGGAHESLTNFFEEVKVAKAVAIQLLWNDSTIITTTHNTTTTKYCTPSIPCGRWYCSCDRNVRVKQAFAPLMGALFLLSSTTTSTGTQDHVYFLPLAECMSSSSTTSANTNHCLPLNCQTTVVSRWKLLIDVLLHEEITKVVFHWQLFLLPIFGHLFGLRDDLKQDEAVRKEYARKLCLIRNVFDPKIAAFVCDSGIAETDLELSTLCQKYDIPTSSGSSRTSLVQGPGPGPGQGQSQSMGKFGIVASRGFEELKSILKLHHRLSLELNHRDGCLKACKGLDIQLVALLSSMELRGVSVCPDNLSVISVAIDHKIEAIVNEAQRIVGRKFNLASPEQVSTILYDLLQLPTPVIGHGHAPGKKHASTSEEDLVKIRTLHPVVNLVLDFRSLSKIATTYIAGLKPFLITHHDPQVFCPAASAVVSLGIMPSSSILPAAGSNSSSNGSVCSDGSFFQENSSKSGANGSSDGGGGFFDVFVPGKRRADGSMVSADPQSRPSMFIHSSTSAFATVSGRGSCRSGQGGRGSADTGATGSGTPMIRCHGNWNLTSVRTGRLSCCKPNMQNMPNRQVVAGIEINVRNAFQATSGRCLISADYSQIEMRILAQLCGDPTMKALFQEQSGDIYRKLSAHIWNKPESHVSDQERSSAKVICLGIIYGMGPHAAATKLNIDVAAAKKINDTFLQRFSHVKHWMNQTKQNARRNGYVCTMLGHRRYLPDISISDSTRRAAAERQAINSVVQGSASDVIKLAMIRMEHHIAKVSPEDRNARLGEPHLIMQIHDELIYEVGHPDGDIGSQQQAFVNILHTCMEREIMQITQCAIPLLISVEVGIEWGDMQPVSRPIG